MRYKVQLKLTVDGAKICSPRQAAKAAFAAINAGGNTFSVRKVLQYGKGGLGPEFRVDIHDGTVSRAEQKSLWEDDFVQAVRLVDEADAAGAFSVEALHDMADSMDLTTRQVVELIDRLRNRWTKIKKENLK